eukprot:jgi/Mesvir1/24341/Mv25247-RA.1
MMVAMMVMMTTMKNKNLMYIYPQGGGAGKRSWLSTTASHGDPYSLSWGSKGDMYQDQRVTCTRIKGCYTAVCTEWQLRRCAVEAKGKTKSFLLHPPPHV